MSHKSYNSWNIFTKDNDSVTIVMEGMYTSKAAKDYVRDNCAVDYCDYYIKCIHSETEHKSLPNGKWKVTRSLK